jgi:hypothetical protein
MKYQLITLAIMAMAITITAQPNVQPSAVKWSHGGDVAAPSDFIGTINASHLNFRTNNQTRLTLLANGDAVFTGQVKTTQGLALSANNNGIKYTSKTSGGGTFLYGRIDNTADPALNSCALSPVATYNHQFGGNVQIFEADANGNYVSGSGLLNLQTWSGGSSIDASIGGQTGNGGLLINYFCGNNTMINTGANGGTVYLGQKVQAAQSVKVGYDAANTPNDMNSGLSVYHNNTTGSGLKFVSYNNGAKLISIENTNFPKSPFTVYGSGKTIIGHLTQTTVHSDAMLTVNGKMVSQSAYIRTADWADYVFDKNYQLPDLYETEAYYLKNKHLPEIPSEKEVIENGINVGEMNKLLLKKIEEMTIQMVKQQKEIDALKAKVK